MNSGMLKEPVVFQRLVPTSDGAGGFTEAWTAVSFAPTRAMVKSLSGGEKWHTERNEATSTHKITTRYNAGITTADRIVIRGRSYNIRFINNLDFEDKWMEIKAEVGVAV